MKTFEYLFSAGETKTFPGGTFFVLVTATSGVDVQYLKNNTSLNEDASGVTSGYEFEYEEGFNFVKVTSATAQTVKVAVSRGNGTFNVSSSILTGGLLDEIGNHAAADADRCMLAGENIVAVAASYSGVQFANTSLLDVAISSLRVNAGAADRFFVSRVGVSTSIYTTSLNFLGGKLSYGAIGINMTRGANVSTTPSSASPILDIKAEANKYIELIKSHPVILQPGKSILLTCQTLNTAFDFTAEWEEY